MQNTTKSKCIFSIQSKNHNTATLQYSKRPFLEHCKCKETTTTKNSHSTDQTLLADI